MRWHLLMNESQFGEAIAEIAARVACNAQALQVIAGNGQGATSAPRCIHSTDYDVSKLLRELAERVDTSFVAQLDRSSARRIAESFGAAEYSLRRAAEQAALFSLSNKPSSSTDLCGHVVSAAEALVKASRHFGNREEVDRSCRALRLSKWDGDDAYYVGLGSLFDRPQDPIDVLKQKAVLDLAYVALVACRRCGRALERSACVDV